MTAENTRMINAETLKGVRRGAILINTGRGGLIDEQAVADALESGQLAAYCADVLTEEPPRADNPLFHQPMRLSRHTSLGQHVTHVSD